MKQALLSFAFLLSILSHAQDSTLPRIEGDTLYTTSGFKVTEGQELKIGTGSMPDGDFKFIRRNAASLWNYYSTTGYQGMANQANAFPRNQAGLKYKVKRIEQRGKKKTGFVYYVVIATGMVKYEMDIDNAIKSGELIVPDEYMPKPKNQQVVVVSQPVSVADELTKLKKLLDDGVLTQEEYDAQKKKLLEKN